jgi:starvation-inducible DNA-binding protein
MPTKSPSKPKASAARAAQSEKLPTPTPLNVAFDPGVSATVCGSLNQLLANYHLYYMNLRGFHWNVRGVHFFTLHQQFELYYTEAALFIDALAERILTLGHTPLHTFPQFLSVGQLPVAENVTDGLEAVKALLAHTNTLASLVRQALEVADAQDDDGTEDLLTPELGVLEKRAWMLAAYLG